MAREKAARRGRGNGPERRAGEAPASRQTVGVAAYFLSLTVENVRCFGEKQTLRLTDAEGRPARWTVLLGENGAGKTTLLQTLVTAAPGHLQVDQAADGASRWALWTWGSGALKSWAIAHLPRAARAGNRPVMTTVKAQVSLSYGMVEPGLPVELSFEIPGPTPRDNPVQITGLPGGPWRTPARPKEVFLAAYGPYRRPSQGRLVELKESSVYLDAYSTLFYSDDTLLNAEEWYLQLDYEAARAAPTKRKVAEKQRDRVRDVLLRVLPGVSDLTPHFGDPGTGKARLMAHTVDGMVPVSELGLGYQSVLAWIVDLASRLFAAFPASPDPLAEPCVVLVDEIDIHLHPRWQRTLLAAISAIFPNAQFIVTAHSPLIVQAAPGANVAVLQRRGDHDHVEIDQAPDSVRHWRVDQILTSDLFRLPSARSPELDDALARRDKILLKDSLTPEDEAQLVDLREQIAGLPGGETPLAMEAEDILRRAAKEVEAGARHPRGNPGPRQGARRS
jgi:energy-coupling factor transporter ATP-binding protein EcfA2